MDLTSKNKDLQSSLSNNDKITEKKEKNIIDSKTCELQNVDKQNIYNENKKNNELLTNNNAKKSNSIRRSNSLNENFEYSDVDDYPINFVEEFNSNNDEENNNNNNNNNGNNNLEMHSFNNSNTYKLEPEESFPYTIFIGFEKYFIVVIVGCSAFFSGVSSNIYLPAIPLLVNDFHVSTSYVNVSVVTYLILQGISPSIWGALTDSIGRRPVYVVCFLIYIAANIGLACSNTFWLIILLRCLQSAGMASTIAIGAGVIGDLTERHNRAGLIGAFNGIVLIGNPVGPIIGGALGEGLGWRSIFWFLVIASGVVFIIMFVFLPETNRAIVGNGTIIPPTINKYPWFPLQKKFSKFYSNSMLNPAPNSLIPKKKYNIFASIIILKEIDIAFIIIATSLNYAGWTMINTAFSVLLSNNYGLSTFDVGLCYIPSGLGCILGPIVSGKILNKVYRQTIDTFKRDLVKNRNKAKINNNNNNNINNTDMDIDIEKEARDLKLSHTITRDFPIYKTRLVFALPSTILFIIPALIIGWTLEYKVHYACPVTFMFFLSFGCTALMGTVSTLSVDLFSNKSSSITASFNLVRCLLAAICVAIVNPIVDGIGAGGCFTIMSGVVGVGYLFIFYIEKNGLRYKYKREERRAARKLASEGKS